MANRWIASLSFVGDSPAAGRLWLSAAHSRRSCVDLAELGPQGFQLLVQHRADRVVDDVLDDRVGRVVGAGRLPLGLVVREVDLALLDDHLEARAPLGLRLGERDVLLLVLFGLGRQVFLGDLELELQQPFVDRAQVADFQRLVVDEDQGEGLLVLVPGEAVDGQGQVAVGDFVVEQEPGDALLPIVGVVWRRVEQAAVVGRDVQEGRPGPSPRTERAEAVVERRVLRQSTPSLSRSTVCQATPAFSAISSLIFFRLASP